VSAFIREEMPPMTIVTTIAIKAKTFFMCG
jgi:hypothetical protein